MQANNIMDIFMLGYISVGLKFGWIGSLVVMALDLRLDRREFDSRPPRPVLGWLTIFGQASHLAQLSLLLRRTESDYRPKFGDALRLGSKGKYGSFHVWINMWMAGETVLTRANPSA